jgi:hypothetical protein
MKKSQARFQVNSRLAQLLSQEYASSEKALKELIDNAWDADAEHVSIVLPEPMTDRPIVISDDGSGMTAVELGSHYLSIAADRRKRSGERTAGKHRLVKGRKGIGKFAGLMTASTMTLETFVRGTKTSFTLRVQDLLKAKDIEEIPIELSSVPCETGAHGTVITLSDLDQQLHFPDPTVLRQILLQDYGREAGFAIAVNDKALGIDDVEGAFSSETLRPEGVGPVELCFAISDRRSVSRQPGIVIRVDGKVVGKPSFFGLDELGDFPPKLLRRLYGEVNADGLRDHVTAGWDGLIENSVLLKRITEMVQPVVLAAFKEKHGREIQLAQARLSRSIRERIAALPENRREFAEKAIRRVLDRYYDEPSDKIEPLVYVLLEAIERTDYGAVVRHLADARVRDVTTLAEVLDEFGLADLAHLAEQAHARNCFLDNLEALGSSKDTLEVQMHKAIENNLWIFGAEYGIFSSNKTLQRVVGTFAGQKFTGKRANKRPDLLLSENMSGEYLLIEFKRPAHQLRRDDYTQGTSYRHDLGAYVHKPIKVLLVGGGCAADFPTQNLEPDVQAMTYLDVISAARRQLDWQLRTQDL